MHELTCAVVSVLILCFFSCNCNFLGGTVLVLKLFFILSCFLGGTVKKSTLYNTCLYPQTLTRSLSDNPGKGGFPDLNSALNQNL